jgi:hypothetical protein
MPETQPTDFRDWGAAAVRLLQGAVYADDGRAWSLTLSSESELAAYFAALGLRLVVDEPEGLAYLRQMTDDELPEGHDELPKLFRKTRLGYDETLLCVLLREELRRFEEDDLHNERCVVEVASLFEPWRHLSPPRRDDVRARRELSAALARLEELGFVRKFGDKPEAWEVRRILKARLPAAELEGLKARLLEAARGRAGGERVGESDG